MTAPKLEQIKFIRVMRKMTAPELEQIKSTRVMGIAFEMNQIEQAEHDITQWGLRTRRGGTWFPNASTSFKKCGNFP